jgi:hypothetical protein
MQHALDLGITFDDPEDESLVLAMAMMQDTMQDTSQVLGPSQPLAAAYDASLDVPCDETKSNLNFLVQMWGFERAFLAAYRDQQPNTNISYDKRLEIKKHAFVAAEMTLSVRTSALHSNEPNIFKSPSEVTQTDRGRAARRTLEFFETSKKARTALAASLLA